MLRIFCDDRYVQKAILRGAPPPARPPKSEELRATTEVWQSADAHHELCISPLFERCLRFFRLFRGTNSFAREETSGRFHFKVHVLRMFSPFR